VKHYLKYYAEHDPEYCTPDHLAPPEFNVEHFCPEPHEKQSRKKLSSEVCKEHEQIREHGHYQSLLQTKKIIIQHYFTIIANQPIQGATSANHGRSGDNVLLKFYRHVPAQVVVCGLFQVAMWVNFRFTHFTLLGAYALSYLFCLLWGNVGYLLLSDAVFCLVTIWFCETSAFEIALDICFWYLLFTLVPGMLVVHIRNELLARYESR
jgi:hypothetical protein